MENKLKKVLILSLSCDIDYYMKEEEVIKETWAKQIINGQKNNFDILFMHSSIKDYIDKDRHTIFTKSGDGYYDTGEKTIKSLIFLKKSNINYDYILLTNTATVINIELVDIFVNSKLIDDDKIYGGKLILPVGHVPFFRGDFILFSKNIAEEIIKSSENFIWRKIPNDEIVICCLGSYRNNQGYEILNQFVELNSIDYIEDFSFNDVGNYFYVNTKIRDIDRKNNEPIICAMKLVWHYIEKQKYSNNNLNGLVRKPTIIELNNGVYKIELIK